MLKSNKPGPSHGASEYLLSFSYNHNFPSEILFLTCGFTAGLNLELNIEQEDYIGVLTPEAGIRMDISTQGEMPFPLERGVSLAPGYATMIGLRKVNTTIKQSTVKAQLLYIRIQKKPCNRANWRNFAEILLSRANPGRK